MKGGGTLEIKHRRALAARSRGRKRRAEERTSEPRKRIVARERRQAAGYVERLIDAGFEERRGIRVGATPLNTVTRAQINR